MTGARIESVQVGRVRQHGSAGGSAPWDRAWTSAFVKEPVSARVRVGRTNLEGDSQADHRHHGGPDQAVLLYAADHYRLWRQELGLEEIGPGGFGENLTVSGVDEWTSCIGDVYRAGECVLQVTSPRGPCYKIGYRWRRADLLPRVEATGRHGWYCRVLEPGTVGAGDPLELLERPRPEWTVHRAFVVWRDRDADPAALERMVREVPEMHRADRRKFARRLGIELEDDPAPRGALK